MSESNRTFENSSLELFAKPRDDRTNEHNYDRDSREKKNGECDSRKQMIDLAKLLRQLSFARVVLKRLPISTEATKFRIIDDLAPVDVGIVHQDIDVNVSQDEHVPPSEYIDDDKESNADSVAVGDTCDIVDDAEQKYEPTSTCNRIKPADMIKRSCPKCKELVVDASVSKKQSCDKCETPLSYQCARCDKQYKSYTSLISHLDTICNAVNLDLKCVKCGYETHTKYLMIHHKTYCSRRTIYSCSHCEFKTRDISKLNVHTRIKHEAADESTTTCTMQKSADMIKRSCPKCKELVVDASVSKKQLCDKCETPLSYQCARCDKQYNRYCSLFRHLHTICNAQNLDLKCSMCDYRTHAKASMRDHLNRCLSGINFSCGLCEFTTKLKHSLLRHMTTTHKDILKVGCSQCKTEPYKCEQCKSNVPICQTCYKGFSSIDCFQEHQKFCKPPVLECKHCSYQTIDDRKLREHIKLEHLSGSMPRALRVKD